MRFHQLCLRAFSGSSFIAQLWRQQNVSYCLVSAISCPCMVGLCAYEIALSRLAPSRSLTQAIAQTRRKAGGHSGLPTEPKARKSAGKRCGTTLSGAHRIFTRRRSLVRVQQSPPRENLGNLVFPRFFSFLMEFSMSACDGHFAVLCFPMLPCFRSQAVLSCTPFVPWEPYKYLRFTVMSSDNIGSICCSCALTASALRLGV